MSVQSDLANSAKCYCFNWEQAKSAVVYLLASKSNLLSMTPAQLSAAAKCYCFDDDRWKSVVSYLLANEAGLSGSTPKQLSESAKCYCFDDETWKKVVVYLLNTGGSGPCPQDMQVAWTPTNLKLGEITSFLSDPSFGSNPSWAGITSVTFNQVSITGFVDIEKASDLTTISAPHLINMVGPSSYFAVQSNPVITSISLPNLISSGSSNLPISDNPNLVTLNVPSWLPNAGLGITLNNNAFNAATVNMVLARCVAVPTYGNTGENVLLNGGTNAAPSGQGVADKATLTGRGATVLTN